MILPVNIDRYICAARSVLLCLLMLCLFLSCEKPPVEPIIRAEKALQEARNAKAHLYAAALYEKADMALTRSKDFVKVKKYKEAEDSAVLAALYARQSTDLVPIKREEYRGRSITALAEMEEKLGGLKQFIEKIKNKRTKKKIESLCKPFITKWALQLRSLHAQLEKEEPYDTSSIIAQNRKLFMDEFGDVEASLHKKKAKP